MKKLAIIIIILCLTCSLCQAQKTTVLRATAEQLPYKERAEYIKQATNYLHTYYSQLMLNVDELMVQQEFIKNNMLGDFQQYKPEFLLEMQENMNFLTPQQYLQELDKQYHQFNLDEIEIKVDNVSIKQEDFFLPNLISCYVKADYDLTFIYKEKTLFKRQCQAYCLFPRISVSITVKLMQVEPVKDIITYHTVSTDINDVVAVSKEMEEAYNFYKKEEYFKAIPIYLKFAQQGNSIAQYNLGVCYDTVDDYQKAVEWYTRAAEQGDTSAQFQLGTLHILGQGVPQDYKKAIEWFTKAAEQGDVDAQYELGICYFAIEDYQKAVEWFTKAAEQGKVYAQVRLGFYYEKGEIVPKDYNKAIEWYTKAAEQGHSGAVKALEALKQK